MVTTRLRAARLPALLAAVATTVLLGACSSGPGTVSKSDVEDQVAVQLAAKVHQPKPAVTCPTGLTAKVGASIQCVLVAQGSTVRYGVKVTVTSVSGSTAHFDIEVANTPLP